MSIAEYSTNELRTIALLWFVIREFELNRYMT